MSTIVYGRCQRTVTLQLAEDLDGRSRVLLARSRDERYTRRERERFLRGAARLADRAAGLRAEVSR